MPIFLEIPFVCCTSFLKNNHFHLKKIEIEIELPKILDDQNLYKGQKRE
jgi:hypothetical protein